MSRSLRHSAGPCTRPNGLTEEPFLRSTGTGLASGTDAGVERTADMNCFMSAAVRPAGACSREPGLQGRFPPVCQRPSSNQDLRRHGQRLPQAQRRDRRT